MMNWIWTKSPVFTDLWTAVRYGKEEICLVDKNFAKKKKPTNFGVRKCNLSPFSLDLINLKKLQSQATLRSVFVPSFWTGMPTEMVFCYERGLACLF